MFPESVGERCHRHLAAQQHDKSLEKKRKTTAFPRPGYRHAQDSVFRTMSARHPRLQEALVLEEVQVPPPFCAGVMGGAKLAALRTSKAFALIRGVRPCSIPLAGKL
jgi:hypothetical protein